MGSSSHETNFKLQSTMGVNKATIKTVVAISMLWLENIASTVHINEYWFYFRILVLERLYIVICLAGR